MTLKQLRDSFWTSGLCRKYLILKLFCENVFPITFQYLIIVDVVDQVSKETDSEMESGMQMLYL